MRVWVLLHVNVICCLRELDIACSLCVLATSVLGIVLDILCFVVLMTALSTAVHLCCPGQVAPSMLLWLSRNGRACYCDSSNWLKIFAKRRDVHLCCIMWHIGNVLWGCAMYKRGPRSGDKGLQNLEAFLISANTQLIFNRLMHFLTIIVRFRMKRKRCCAG